ncbi:hypothetical protein PTSG_00587 [Salpingoeca rosetta]|uniref:MalT-like TPR region domain-containing protein n=1 Tax=Salpingoeca rosetta (strain ATCC 50818 / BSB-021) TaxID=946362 RepID=F2TWW6_SALR5|nr:uncharacterized protein PTSG_00587 [Salpingoeca rosetta]EGD72562.1 hypothetical protein PTSG_00587 [Salpingoeca rosetta]|eukprot:XP_004999131.1 hypothetical protein PTSG_00587 [Salpingoeca rosetta]
MGMTSSDAAYAALRQDALEQLGRSHVVGAGDCGSGSDADSANEEGMRVPVGITNAGDGRLVDMRPPHVQLVACEQAYAELVASRNFRHAVHTLITRLSLTKLVYGREHIAVAQGHITLGRAYFELLNYPKQALDHGQRAKAMHAHLKQHRAEHHLHRHQLAALAASALCLMGQALVELNRAEEAVKALRRSLHLTQAVSKHRLEKDATARPSASKKGKAARRAKSPTAAGRTKSTASASASSLSSSSRAASAKAPAKTADVDNQGTAALDREEVRARVYLCRALMQQDKTADAETEASELQHILDTRAVASSDPPLAILAYTALAENTAAASKQVAFLQHACDIAEESKQPVDAKVQCWIRLAEAHAAQDNLAEAETLFAKALDVLAHDFDAHTNTILSIQESRARVLVRQNRRQEAIDLLSDVKERVMAKFGQFSLRTANVCHFLGSLYLAVGDNDSALACFQERHEALRHAKGANHALTQETKQLVESLSHEEKPPPIRP